VEGERGRNQAAKYFGLELPLPVVNSEDNKKSDSHDDGEQNQGNRESNDRFDGNVVHRPQSGIGPVDDIRPGVDRYDHHIVVVVRGLRRRAERLDRLADPVDAAAVPRCRAAAAAAADARFRS